MPHFFYKTWVIQKGKLVSLKSAYNACANFVLCNRHVHVPHRHAPDIIDVVVPVSHLTKRCRKGTRQPFRHAAIMDGIWFGDPLAVFRLNFIQNCEFCFFIQNANKFRDFVLFVQNEFLLSLSIRDLFSASYQWANWDRHSL